MAFCTNCGNKMNEDDIFCTNCGKSINEELNNNNNGKSPISYGKYFKIITKPADSLWHMGSSMNGAVSFILTAAIPAAYGLIITLLFKQVVSYFTNLVSRVFGYPLKSEDLYFLDTFMSEYSFKIFIAVFILIFVTILIKFLGIILFSSIFKGRTDGIKIWNGILAAEIFLLFNFILFLLIGFISMNAAYFVYILETCVCVLSFYMYLSKILYLPETKTVISMAAGYIFKLLAVYGLWKYLLYYIKHDFMF